VSWPIFCICFLRTSFNNRSSDSLLLVNSNMSRSNWVDLLLVNVPEDCLIHESDVLARTLLKNKIS
jgi:hypothetical protein